MNLKNHKCSDSSSSFVTWLCLLFLQVFFLTHLAYLCICEHLCSLQLTTFWSLQYIVVETMEEDNNRGTVIDLSYAGLNYSLLTEAFK